LVDSEIDDQPLWEYPAIASSQPHTFFTFDFKDEIKDQSSNGSLQPLEDFNGMALWMEWVLGESEDDGNDRVLVSTGPTQDRPIGKSIDWDRNSKQGVYFFNDIDKAGRAVTYNSSFSSETGNLSFRFQLK
jgi:hypothetical protein